MSHARKIRLPFAWIAPYWTPIALALIVGAAAFYRFCQLATLPPGLDETSARIGLQALNLGVTHWLPPLDGANSYTPLWVWLQALNIQIFGHTVLALRIWPALLGTLAVLATWFWIRDWFGQRTAWVVAIFVAVSPWAVTVSRGGLPSALFPLLVPLTLWAGTRAWRTPGTQQYAILGAILALDLLSGPIGWILAACTLILGAWKLHKDGTLLSLSNSKLAGAGTLAIGAAFLAYLIGTSLPAINAMPHVLNLPHNLSVIGHNLVKVLLMFNVHGDENYRHNLAGEPLLNAFAGIMMIAGLLVAISKLHQRIYQVFLMLLCALLFPAVLATSGVPNSSWAVGALPLIFALAGIGTSYMLQLWYTTFPINSAARATGQAAMALLLVLSSLQGYTQYFRAWAGSTAVYTAYNEGAERMAAELRVDKFSGERYVITPVEQIPVIDYLAYDQPNYTAIEASKLEALPVAVANRLFYIATASRDDAVKILKAKFPGSVLRPHYSPFNQVEIYYTYEVHK